jgi:beta-lactamase class A
MSLGGVTQALIRPHVPEGWAVADKSGGGRDHTRNIVAMLSPGPDEHYIVAIFLSDTPADWDGRNAAVSDIARGVVDLIRAHREAP